jgi:hypothetical protein
VLDSAFQQLALVLDQLLTLRIDPQPALAGVISKARRFKQLIRSLTGGLALGTRKLAWSRSL